MKGHLLCEILICTLGHKASGGSRRRSPRSPRSLLWTAGKAYTPAVVPICCLSVSCLSVVCLLPVCCLFVLCSFFVRSLLVLCSFFVRSLSIVCCLSVVFQFLLYTLSTFHTRFLVYLSEHGSDVSTWITINKTADFLIVTHQNPLFWLYLGTISGLQSIKWLFSWS